MSSARTAFALAALAALATIGQHHAAALPVDLSAPAAAPRGDGLVPDAGAQRARRVLGDLSSWAAKQTAPDWVGDAANSGIQAGNHLVNEAKQAGKAAHNSVSQAGNNLAKDWNGGNNAFINWWSGAANDVTTFNLPGYGKHCGKDNNNDDDVAAIDPVDKACQFHDTCTKTNYWEKSPKFVENFKHSGVTDWGPATRKNYGSCSCEKQSLRLATFASCTGVGWWGRRWQCAINKELVVAFFEANVKAMC